ncbi:MAG: hypothetical protein ACFE8J_06780 [Candidatus Heimdallarchaeota archaeon]
MKKKEFKKLERALMQLRIKELKQDIKRKKILNKLDSLELWLRMVLKTDFETNKKNETRKDEPIMAI